MLSTVQASTAASAPDPVRSAIDGASRATGIPFDYLLRTAQRESNLDPSARAPTSSAAGLFQFLDQTWLATLSQSGAQHGYGREAAQIGRGADGRYAVADPSERSRIMALRLDPAANAVMAGAFTQRNGEQLTQALGRAPSQGELYMAHFLGANGAARFLTQAAQTPDAAAATQFPDAARANRRLFYGSDGAARTFAEVQALLVSRHAQATVAGTETLTAVQPAAQGAQAGNDARAPAFTPRSGPVFHSLFQAGGRDAVSPVVTALWGQSGARNVSLYASSGREPFFPSSGNRVGVQVATVDAGLAAAETAAAAAASVGSVSSDGASSEAIRIPLPPDRPADLGRAASASLRRPPAGMPLDLLSYARSRQ